MDRVPAWAEGRRGWVPPLPPKWRTFPCCVRVFVRGVPFPWRVEWPDRDRVVFVKTWRDNRRHGDWRMVVVAVVYERWLRKLRDAGTRINSIGVERMQTEIKK